MKKKGVLAILTGLSAAWVIYACKHTTPGSGSSSKALDTEKKPLVLFDLNDVSILVKNPETANADDYIHIGAMTVEGPFVTQAMFDGVFKMLDNPRPRKYEEWAVAAIRIDNCAKVIAQAPCQAQIRLVFQPLDASKKKFDDQALHIAFNVFEAEKMAMFKDFLDLKKASLPATTNGPLGEHPILAKEGMAGAYAKRLNALVMKYAIPSRIERISVMTSSSAGSTPSGNWIFAVTQPVKDQKIIQSQIPCQDPSDLTNKFETISGIFGGATPGISPDMVGCQDVDITPILLKGGVTDENKKIVFDAAIKTNNPNQVFFGSTTCVNCHLASRRLDQKEPDLSTRVDGNPGRYLAPTDVSTGVSAASKDDNVNLWGIRAFGWGEFGNVPGITVYTLNDTMRVAHELNELIREGKLQ